MRNWVRCLGFVMAIVACSVSQATERIGVGVKAGTLGLGADLTGRISNWFNVRGSVNAVDFSASYDETNVDYDGDVKLGAYGVMVDFFPLRGNFRVTAGLMRNRNAIDIAATPTQNVQIGDNVYTPAEIGTLSGTMRFKRTAPYLGIGLGNAARGPDRIRFLLDVGILKQGSGDVGIASSQSGVSAADLRREEANIEDDISDYDFWPVVAFGISIRI